MGLLESLQEPGNRADSSSALSGTCRIISEALCYENVFPGFGKELGSSVSCPISVSLQLILSLGLRLDVVWFYKGVPANLMASQG